MTRDIEDMTDAQDDARAEALREAVAICKRVRAEECENDDQAIGALECALAIQDAINATAAARPSQAGDERVARLVRASERFAGWTIGGKIVDDPDNRAKYPLLVSEVLELRAALAAMDTPKGGGDE